jgi:hypothetical protein
MNGVDMNGVDMNGVDMNGVDNYRFLDIQCL